MITLLHILQKKGGADLCDGAAPPFWTRRG